MSGGGDLARPLGHLMIITVVLLAVTLPLWVVFAGMLLKDGNYGAAAGFFGLVLAFVSVPILLVVVAVRLFLFVAGRQGRAVPPLVVAGVGAMVGTGLIWAYMSNVMVALLLGVIPGAGVALAVMPRGRAADFDEDVTDE